LCDRESSTSLEYLISSDTFSTAALVATTRTKSPYKTSTFQSINLCFRCSMSEFREVRSFEFASVAIEPVRNLVKLIVHVFKENEHLRRLALRAPCGEVRNVEEHDGT
jgi:hypothetical protein